MQPEEGDADLRLVLHPNYWGKSKAIYYEIIRRAFGEMGFRSVIVLLPPSYTKIRGMARLGFEQDGELENRRGEVHPLPALRRLNNGDKANYGALLRGT